MKEQCLGSSLASRNRYHNPTNHHIILFLFLLQITMRPCAREITKMNPSKRSSSQPTPPKQKCQTRWRCVSCRSRQDRPCQCASTEPFHQQTATSVVDNSEFHTLYRSFIQEAKEKKNKNGALSYEADQLRHFAFRDIFCVFPNHYSQNSNFKPMIELLFENLFVDATSVMFKKFILFS